MNIRFSVWLHIEAEVNEGDEYVEMDAPGASLIEFDSYPEAWNFCERLGEFVGFAQRGVSASVELDGPGAVAAVAMGRMADLMETLPRQSTGEEEAR